jgi:benzoyl-CoA reductase subunit D
MITAGIDIGARSVKVVLVGDGEVIGRARERSGFDPAGVAARVMKMAAGKAGLDAGRVLRLVATGSGRGDVEADGEITEVSATARGIHHLRPGVRTAIDLGAEEGRGVKVGREGRVVDFVINEKCAAGSGAFIEAMARAVEVPLEEFGTLSLESDRQVPMNAQCAVFAESEVVSLVHSRTPRRDIARAVHDAIASRTVSMVRRIGIEDEVALVGGVAHNVGFRDALERALGTSVVVPAEPEYVGALGAALVAASEE